MNTVEIPHASNKVRSNKHGAAPRSSRLWLWVIITIIAVAIGFTVGIVPRLRARDALRHEAAGLSAVTVNVASPSHGKATPLLSLPAEVKPFSDAPIYARANGFVKRFYVDIGANVQAGQLLAEIDAPELDRELESARANLSRDEAALELAKTTFTRWQELQKTSSVSDQETAEKKADFALKTATVGASSANVHRLEELKKFTRVTAPFAGTITMRNIDVGDLINAGSAQQIFHLADTARLRVFVHLPQSVAAKVQVGGTAELSIPDAPSHKYKATVVRTAGTIAAATRTLLTELEVNNANGEILAGSYAQVSFADISKDAPLVLPSNTLIFRGDGTLVASLTPENKVAMRPVTIGRDFGKTIEITSGVTESDKVILNPADSLTEGQVVQVAVEGAEEGRK